MENTYQPERILGAMWLAILAAWAGIPYPEQALLVFMGLDLFIGVIAAVKTRTFSSRTLREGIMGKFATIGLLIAAHWLEVPGMDVEFDKWVAWALCLYEFTSLVENYAKFGKVPPPLLRGLEALRRFTGEDASGSKSPDDGRMP